MNRTQKLKINLVTSLINRITRIVSGLILPRLILLYFGSATNGLVASINQFLSIITLLDLGVGSVVQSALYRPLAKKNVEEVSSVLLAAKKYFQKIAYILIIYVGALIILYPLLIDSSFGFLPTAFLIFSLSISLFGQYYFGIVNELLLNANQQGYIQYASEIVVVILNTAVSVILITQGASIQVVQLGAGLVFLIRPVFLSWYVNKHFNIDYDSEVKEDPLPQKWSGMGQHIAYMIQSSTDIVTLTLFSTLGNISVYSVYNMVVQAIHMLVSSLTTSIGSFLGELLANDEIYLLNNYFNRIEWVVHTGVIYLYGMTAILINSFVMLYTTGVEDINYHAPLFSLLLVLSKAIFSLRIPYRSLIFSAGHFQQTQRSSFIEAGINVIVSVLLVNRFGLIGVAIGTLAAMTYHILYLVVYLSKNIVHRPLDKFIKHIFVDIISLVSILGLGMIISNIYQIQTIVDWLVIAVILAVLSLTIILIINSIFYRDIMTSAIKSVLKRS